MKNFSSLKKAFLLSISCFLTICFLFSTFSCASKKGQVSADYSVWAPSVDYVPDSKPDKLTIQFYASAAKLQDVGKEPSVPISISPNVAGSWRWVSDSELEFTPTEAWSLGTKYSVSIPQEDFAKHIYIKSNPSFSTPAFEVYMESSEFYINPTDPNEKRAICTIKASHPMKSEEFEKLVSMKLTIPGGKGDKGSVKQDYKYSVSFDKDFLTAEIVSDPIPMPPRTSKMDVKISSGIEALQKATCKKSFSATISVPGMSDYVSIRNIDHQLVLNDSQNYDQIIRIETKGKVQMDELLKHLEVYILPVDKPALEGWKEEKNCNWEFVVTDFVTDDILKLSEKIPVTGIETPEVATEVNNFKISAPASRYVFINITGDINFFGGYKLQDGKKAIKQLKKFPKELKIVSDGTILSLSGSKKLSIYSRGVSQVDYTLSRIKPKDVNHLVSMSNGDMRNFKFNNYNFNENNIAEKYHSSFSIMDAAENRSSYFSYDFAPYLRNDFQKNLTNGLFIFEVSQNPEDKMNSGRNDYDYYHNRPSDKRLILVTDLTFIVKRNMDDTRDVYVQSAATGRPVPNATVSVIALNGNSLVSTITDSNGHASLPKFSDPSKYTQEHQPTAFVVKTENDLSFMPFSQRGRYLDYSNFDVGGEYGFDEPKKINSFMFSDRGIYRPGEKVHIGVISKSGDWKENLSNIPVEVEVVDSQNSVLYTNRFKFSSSGFDEVNFGTHDYSPTGVYEVTLYRLKEKDNETQRIYINSTQIKVEEFLPDSLRIATSFEPLPNSGWITPQQLKFNVALANLFGTPARGNDIKVQMDLYSGFPHLSKYSDYSFADPFSKENSYSEFLGTKQTDENGQVSFDIDMSKFEKSTYRMTLFAEGFEKGSGRSVTRSSVVYVSPLEYLLGYKADGDLDYIKKDTKRKFNFIAIDQNLEKIAVNDITLKIEEVKYISTLVKQPNGIYKYQSVKKKSEISSQQINITKDGFEYYIPTKDAGEYVLSLVDKNGLVFASINYSIIGQTNLTRSLTRTAELEIKLEKSDLVAGEMAKVFIKAPYAGSGLITVERDKVYSAKWFSSDTLASVQTIQIPAELEGNAYINVMFTRSAQSEEIFMSPFCYGAIPFSIDRSRRTANITLNVPTEVKSGTDLEIKYSTSDRSKIVVFAVDEGILQVGSYKLPDPLSFFFKKRALQVGTSQLMDLILPEYNVLKTVTATGGGAGMAAMLRMNNNLNPFRRKVNEPVSFWSGILDSDATTRTVKYHVPDYFNGNLKVMAIAVNSEKIGVAESSTLGTNTFIISPNTPLVAAPGDEFDVSVSVTNNHKGSGKKVPVKLEIATTKNLEIVGDKVFTEKIDEGHDKTFFIRVKALENLGNADIVFTASDASEKSKFTSSLSVRPPVPYRVWTKAGYAKNNSAKTSVEHRVYDELSIRKAYVSPAPSSYIEGMKWYLEKYPYGCSEQITSQAYPYLYPDFVKISGKTPEEAKDFVNSTISILQSRQLSNGGIGFWTSASQEDQFISLYCAEFLMDAKNAGYYVSSTFFDSLMSSLYTIATSSETDEYSIYLRSYAIYLLTKNENVTTSLIESLELDKTRSNFSSHDYETLYLAASYKMLKQDKKADELIAKAVPSRNFDSSWIYHCGLHYVSTYVDIVSNYFPETMKSVKAKMLEEVSNQIEKRWVTTLSASAAIRAMKSFADNSNMDVYTVTQTVMNAAKEKTQTALTMSGNFSAFGSTYSGDFSDEATEILYETSKKAPLFYQTILAGFERELPKKEVKNGLEIFREYTTVDGGSLDKAKVGDDILVKVSARSLNGTIYNVAIVDLQPSCLEADIESVRTSSIARGDKVFKPDYVDSREDRIVIYGTIKNNVSTFTYKAKLVNSGSFVVPPLFAESMYDENINAYSLASHLEVGRAE